MLEDFLQDVYDKALALELMKEASFYASIRHVFNRLDYWNEATLSLEKIINDLKEKDTKKAVQLVESSLKVQEYYSDIHKYVAIIDTEVIPKVSDYLKGFNSINVSDGEWTLESSETGFLTLKNSKGMYLHSPSDPMWESFLYAYSIFDPAARAYYVLGGGLGYLPYQLWRMSKGEADIYVFEINRELSEYADLYGVLSYIDEDKLHYITGDDTDIILEKYAENIPNCKIVRTMYYWDITKYDGPYADFFRIELSNEVTHRAFELKWRSNYDGNMALEHKYFPNLDTEDFKDEWLVVGAGPSLNYNEDFIRDSIGKRTICVVNSAFKWFYLHNIKPDLCTACDPDDLMIPHIEGYEEFSEGIPLIADCVTNHTFVELYRGPRYYIYSTASLLTVGKDNVIGDTWSIGGTVTSLALGVAQKMKAKKVYLIGADMGYPDGITFADGVGHDVEKWNREEETTVSVDDKIIPTSIIFREYKCMLEDQIAGCPDVEVINKSLHGAFLKGTYCDKWWESIPFSSDANDYMDMLAELKSSSNILGWKEKYYIFWQIIGRIEAERCTLSDNINTLIEEVYTSIYEAFKSEFDVDISIENRKNGQTYIFINEFLDNKDDYSQKILKLAQKEVEKKHSVLIVNSAEKMGGEKVAMHNPLKFNYNDDLSVADHISYKGNDYAFFQFPKGMPDTQYYLVFLDSISKNCPDKIIVSCKYSLLADFCCEKMNIRKEIVY